MSQRTFSIIKPDAIRKGHAGAILAEIETAGFRIVAIKKLFISKPQAEGFYSVHRERPFFNSLTTFMSSGPIVALVLEKESGECGGGDDPKEVRGVDRGECDPWIGWR